MCLSYTLIVIMATIAINKTSSFTFSTRASSPILTNLQVKRRLSQKQYDEIKLDPNSSTPSRTPTRSEPTSLSLSSSRRERGKETAQAKAVTDKNVADAITNINDLVSQAKNRDLSRVQQIVTDVLEPNNDPSILKKMLRVNSVCDFKLCFVGSDEAVCTIGSGLHNVPLANLDEIFVSLSANRIVVREVIRLTGPFPNVLNTLLGDAIVRNNNILATKYTSVIDGTGKELISPNEPRQASYTVAFASELYIVMYSYSSDTPARSVRDLLIFERVPDLEAELMSNRVGSKKTNIV